MTKVLSQTPPDDGKCPSGFVALIGQPNVGKSTLLNALLGVKIAIATSKPQTTRKRILGVKTLPGQGQLCFVDTPGIHQSKKRLNQAMVHQAVTCLDEVDLICHVVDAPALLAHQRRNKTSELSGDEEMVLRTIAQNAKVPVVLVVNKVDILSDKAWLLPLMQQLSAAYGFADIVPISAAEGENLELLEEILLKHLPVQTPLFAEDFLTDQAERALAAEFIREQIMEQTRREIPYCVAVEVERFVEKPRRNMLEITAVIHVERDSQKSIVIGDGGERLKSIGIAARQQLEAFFGRQVYLQTLVRVESGWTDSRRGLMRFGYE